MKCACADPCARRLGHLARSATRRSISSSPAASGFPHGEPSESVTLRTLVSHRLLISISSCRHDFYMITSHFVWDNRGSREASHAAPAWAGRVCFEILVIYLYLLAPDPSHLSRRDKTCPVSKSSHLSRRDMTFGSASKNFLRALRARDYK